MAIANLTATLVLLDRAFMAGNTRVTDTRTSGNRPDRRQSGSIQYRSLEEKKMTCERHCRPGGSARGFSLIELLTVLALAGILTALAIPQIVSQRRLTRSAQVPREILTQLRYTRQLAMSQRRAFTFQYDDTAKQINVIGPIPAGAAALLVSSGYPNNAGSATVALAPLTQGGLSSTEISYGIPTALPTGALGDGVSKTALDVNSKLNITFQPDGSVIDTNGVPQDRAMFIFNNKAAQASASAISVLGATGRVKVWRYTVSGNKYAE
jgi:prepilin-type N-terminal cleavage/methylation domain-containing protein